MILFIFTLMVVIWYSIHMIHLVQCTGVQSAAYTMNDMIASQAAEDETKIQSTTQITWD